MAFSHTVVCFGVLRLDLESALAVLFSELRLLDLAVRNGAVGIIRGLLRVVVNGLRVVLNRFLNIAKFELIISLVFALLRF